MTIMTAPKDDPQKVSPQEPDSLVSEFIRFLKQNRRFWLIPVIIALLVLAALLFLATSNVAEPVFYTPFQD